MTENEAIEQLEILPEWNREDRWLDAGDMEELVNICVKALKEIQQYRAIGTVEECREAMEKQRRKKLLGKNKQRKIYMCQCGTTRINTMDNFCCQCGTKIDWFE